MQQIKLENKKFYNAYYSGLSGLQLPVPKYLFPEPYQHSSRLHYYASLFNSIEINSSFYKVPMENTVTKWANDVADDFRFTFKLWRQITHVKALAFEVSDVRHFMKTISCIGSKRGCLLIQFPPGLQNESIDQLARLLQYVRQEDPEHRWNIAVEFRNNGWYNYDVYELLDTYKIALVVHDKPKSATPMLSSSMNFVYARFHGPTGNYDGSYTDDFLCEYAEYIKSWLAEGKTVYVYFNNTKGNALQNLGDLNRFIFSQ